MRKNRKKGIVAAVVACAMLTAVPSVAMADTVDYYSRGNSTAFTKTWKAASNQQLNDTEEFTFTRTFVSYDGSSYDSNATASEDDQTEKSDITATTTWQTNADGGTSASDVVTYDEVLEGLTFDKPGIYIYSIVENESSNVNVKEDWSTYSTLYLVVYVEWANTTNPGSEDDNGQITAIQSAYFTTNTDLSVTADKVDSPEFVNTAATNSNVVISNTVTGTAANTSDYFTYTVELHGGTGSYTISYSDDDAAKKNASVTSVTTGSENQVTIYLKSGQTATIENVPESATYEVTQVANDYDTSSFVVTDNDTTTADSGSVTTNTDLTATGSVVDDTEDTVVFTNTKGLASATGITANTLPFVVLGVIVVAGVVVLLVKRRRRSYEEF